MLRIIAILAFIICLALGLTFRQSPYQLTALYHPQDQAALDHRDSPYSHVSWVCSEAGNYAQLRFFDKVEGGVCLEPSWDSYAALNDERLKHLIPQNSDISSFKVGRTWPEGWAHPNMGTLTNTKYICLFPAALMLDEEKAVQNRMTLKSDILIVGLGSGVGPALYAHHYPEASIRVVDIDIAVIDMVREHYPFLAWLETQKTSDGRPRLQLDCADARQYIHFEELRRDNGIKYDVILLDAYTSGSTIPSHLMTKEFYEECHKLLKDRGILANNIIGSYEGQKRLLLGGAIRSMRAAGFSDVLNIPVLSPSETPPIEKENARNNMTFAAKFPLSQRQNNKSWKAMANFELYPEFATNTYISTLVRQLNDDKYMSSALALNDKELSITLAAKARKVLASRRDQKNSNRLSSASDDQLIMYFDDDETKQEIRTALGEQISSAFGWKKSSPYIRFDRVDWVLHARRTWERCLKAAQSRNPNDPTVFIHCAKSLVGTDGLKGGIIDDAPLFTDSMPNADIVNNR